MKTKTLLIAAVMFLSISVAAFAQATYTVSASPVPLAVSTGYAEKVGSIGFSTVPESDITVTGYIYIKYGSLPIANTGALQNYIKIDAFTDEAGMYPPNIEVADIEQDTEGNDVLVLSVYPYPNPAAAARLYSFRVSGVRVDVTEWMATEPLRATIYATENLVTNGEVTTTVLYGTKKPISAFALATDPVVLSALNGGSGTVDLDVTEGFRNAFAKYNDDTQNTRQILKIKLPNVPTGITLVFPAYSEDGNWRINTTAPYSATVTGNGSTKYVKYDLIEDTDVAAVEDVIFAGVQVTASSPSLTLWDTSLTLIPSVTLGINSGDTADAFANHIPRYIADYVAATTLFTWEEEFDNTFLMMPYATTDVGFDTGIAVANTTASGDGDEEDWPMNPNLLQGGEIVFRFFDKTQGMVEVKTSDAAILATLKQGVLDAEGKLPAGKSYIILISQLLDAAGFEGTFSGYVLINAKFPFAHGQYFVSDFGDFTNGALMLVVKTRDGSRSFRGESLGQ